MNNTALKTAPPRAKPPTRTPERQALPDAIVRRESASLALESAQRALSRARAAWVDGEAKVEKARAEIVAAGDRDANAVVRALADGEPVPANATRKARMELESAEDELNAATTARAKLKVRLGDAEDALLGAQNHVTPHVDIVLRAGAPQVLADAEDAAQKLRSLLPMLRFFLSPAPESLSPRTHSWDYEATTMGRERANRRAFTGARARTAGEGPFAELRTAIERFLAQSPLLDAAGWYRHPGLEQWRKRTR
jgi:hypothetical protein